MTKVWSIAKSSAICALSLFTCLNLFLNKQDELHGFAASTVKANLFDYPGAESNVYCLKQPPNVLLLGSSLFVHPEWCVDKAIPIDDPLVKSTIVSESHYHLARGLDVDLTSVGFDSPHVYNLAVGGGLISDSYLLLRRYLKVHPKPKLVVLDCAPRSFYDSRITDPDRTPVFDYFFDFRDCCDLGESYIHGFSNQTNFIFSKLCFTYHHRLSIANDIKKEFLPLLLTIESGTFLHGEPSVANLELKAPSSKPIDTSNIQALPAVAMSGSTGENTHINALIRDNLAVSLKEYYWRYQGLDQFQLIKQMQFLKRISEFCATEQIRLIVVNMPLTTENKQLLPQGFYDLFTHAVKSTLSANGSVFLDLSSPDWSSDCFYDSVHMNEKGGRKLNKLLAQAVAKEVLSKRNRNLLVREQLER